MNRSFFTLRRIPSKGLAWAMLTAFVFCLASGLCVSAHAAQGGENKEPGYFEKLKKAYWSSVEFPQGEGSEEVVEDFVAEVLADREEPNKYLGSEALRVLAQKAGGESADALRRHLISPFATSIDFEAMTGEDRVLGPGSISRRASVMVDVDMANIEYTSLVILEFELKRKGGDDWVITKVSRVREDFTVANTSFLYKVFYFWVVLSLVGTIFTFFQLFSPPDLNTKTLVSASKMAGRQGVLGTVITIGLVFMWLPLFFPKVFMSHVGLFWGMTLICQLLAQNLGADNLWLHHLRIPAQRLLSWVLVFLPLLFFFSMPEKFAPVQTSVMDLEYRLPSKVRIVRPSPVRDAAAAGAKRLSTVKPGDEFMYIDKVRGDKDVYYKVLTKASRVGYVKASSARLVEKVRRFETESDFLDEVVAYTRPLKPIDVDPRVGRGLGEAYARRALAAARRSSIKDHMEALSQYSLALRYDPKNQKYHLGAAFSILEINRRLLNDNLFNLFGLMHNSAVSYNKVNALSAHSIGYLTTYVKDKAFLNERDGLIGVAYLTASDDDEILERIQRIEPKGPYSRLARVMFEDDAESALPICEEAIRQDPKSSLMWQERGRLLLALEKPKQADRAFNRALKLGPGNDQAVLGSLASRVEDIKDEKALELATKAAAMESNFNSQARGYALMIEYGTAWWIFYGVTVFLFWLYLFVKPLANSIFGTFIKIITLASVFAAVCLNLYYQKAASLSFAPELPKILVSNYLHQYIW